MCSKQTRYENSNIFVITTCNYMSCEQVSNIQLHTTIHVHVHAFPLSPPQNDHADYIVCRQYNWPHLPGMCCNCH